MRRRALIIAAPGADLPGVKKDAANISAHLQSSRGGAWRIDEITILTDPAASAVDAQLSTLPSLCDYSFVAFAGHGRYNVQKKTTEIQLRPGVLIEVDRLRRGGQRHTLMVDTCRVLFTEQLVQKGMAASVAIERFAESSARRIFDSHLEKCPPGIVELYSCEISETAGEDASGGYYTSALLENSKLWSGNATSGTVLSIKEAHEMASISVRQKSGNRQNPRAGYPRSQPYFPFAVKS